MKYNLYENIKSMVLSFSKIVSVQIKIKYFENNIIVKLDYCREIDNEMLDDFDDCLV